MTAISGKIGFIGIGAMGTPMAANLAKAGYKLVIYDIDPKRTADFASTHEVEVASNLAEVGTQCGTVITMLPDDKAVRKALCGESANVQNCAMANMKVGSTVIDMSSSSPVSTRALGGLFEARGVKFIDAPVSGGVRRAVTGELAIMVGGDAAILEACRPILEKLGKQIFHAGPLGAGHAIKALNNYVSAAGLVAACEAVIVGQRFGLFPNVVVDILNASSGMNNTTKAKMKQFMLSATFDAGFTTGLMAKDLRTALEVARAVNGPSQLVRHCVETWNEAEAALGPRSDHTAIYKFLERLE
ncbi:MAG: oxidoreductase [Burkholderiales bacterium]|jgi:3-hydroxyisobutyrate dehydrogenase|nr:oxidoreductase [Burkholderiales bacterium]